VLVGSEVITSEIDLCGIYEGARVKVRVGIQVGIGVVQTESGIAV